MKLLPLLLLLAGCSAQPKPLTEWADLGLSREDVASIQHYAQFKHIK